MKNNFNAFFIYANNSYIFPSIISCYIHTASTFDLFSYILHTHVIVHETDFMGTFMQNSLFHSHFMNKITSSESPRQSIYCDVWGLLRDNLRSTTVKVSASNFALLEEQFSYDARVLIYMMVH